MATQLLAILREQVAERASAMTAQAGGWLCRRGCDHCCRHLAAVPEASAAEWGRVEAAVHKLPAPVRSGVEQRLVALAGNAPRPVVCPFLEPAQGICLVYAERPLACRTYGFYVERGIGWYCAELEALAERGELEGILWGNQETLSDRAAALGPAISLTGWFSRDTSEGCPPDSPSER